MVNRSDKNEFHLLGLMSGTSLDGLDLAHCTFHLQEDKVSYKLNAAETIPYPEAWLSRLSTMHTFNASDFWHTHVSFGHYMGMIVKDFLLRYPLPVDYIASHGHTIFHQPRRGFTTQVGDGAALAVQSGYPVICDFRSSDLAYGGQGAPLVPIGDRLLFGEYKYCLNLGGFGNISYEANDNRIAYDICPVNFVMNQISRELGLEYDQDGRIAASGVVIDHLLEQLNLLPYYAQLPPKSLGREWVETEVNPLIRTVLSIPDRMRTMVEHIAIQTGKAATGATGDKLFITGGGSRNSFLLDRIRQFTNCSILQPDPLLVDFKEALVFAFLGLLRVLNKPNCLSSVTGASKNACGGAIYLP